MTRPFKIYHGPAMEVLRTLESESVQTCVTSPPYYGLRDYGVDGQLGMEETPEAYCDALVGVLREVRRVLREDGTLWLNLGDSYAGSWGAQSRPNGNDLKCTLTGGSMLSARQIQQHPRGQTHTGSIKNTPGIKPKDLIGIPWLVAFALRADGWYLRSDIIWAKTNCMPESVTDRPTRAHEYIFLLSKSRHYYYDHEAIKEPAIYDVDGTGTAARKARAHGGLKSHPTGERAGIRPAGFKDAAKMNGKNSDKQAGHSRRHNGFNDRWDKSEASEALTGMRNKRDVWTVAPAQFAEAHFATFSTALIEPCILAGCPEGGTVLDPFTGSGTTGMVALRLGRNFTGIELNPTYVEMARNRILGDAPLLNRETA